MLQVLCDLYNVKKSKSWLQPNVYEAKESENILNTTRMLAAKQCR
jgi:hypothetical protein